MSTIDVRRVIADIRGIDVASAPPSVRLTDAGLSSLDVVALLVRLEELLDRTLPYEELSSVETLGGLEALVSRLADLPDLDHTIEREEP